MCSCWGLLVLTLWAEEPRGVDGRGADGECLLERCCFLPLLHGSLRACEWIHWDLPWVGCRRKDQGGHLKEDTSLLAKTL